MIEIVKIFGPCHSLHAYVSKNNNYNHDHDIDHDHDHDHLVLYVYNWVCVHVVTGPSFFVNLFHQHACDK
jgi:hypothetical protein